jgi:CRISPR/Cas system endoribonuclease Cas6 (RAMP superfamily)
MNMGGIVGEIEFKNLNKESYEVLKLGELLGVGKQTVFGLGKIKMEELSV